VETVVGKGYRFITPVEGRGWDRQAPRSDIEAARPSSTRWRRTFPSYYVTRGKQEFVLDTGENLVGRDPAAPVYVDHPSVSRRHARILVRPERAVLEDLKSRNGTYLEGKRIDTPAEIHDGAIIGLGPITLTFRVLSAPASTLPMSGRGRQIADAES
jgi:pSer/pThr/pTyr-binding forkhead associated (FHA) protein